MKELGVIILNWNGLELLKQFIGKGVEYTVSDSCDLIVADNGSDDGSVAWLRRNYPQVIVLELGKNYGFAEGYNRAIDMVDYRFVTLLNSDVEVTPGWWQPILRFLQVHDDVGAVQPKIRSWHDKSKFEYAGGAGGFLDNLGYPYCRGRLFDVVETDIGQYDGPAADVVWASGACLTMPRSVYLELGGLDSKFFAHMEEIDLCCRVLNAGLRVCALTDSIIYHVGGASLEAGNPKKTYLNFRNNLLLLHKNLPRKTGRRKLFIRRLADTLAFGMFVLKFDWPNAKALLRAHRDFIKMKKEYTQFPDKDILSGQPGADRSAVVARYFLRKKSLDVN